MSALASPAVVAAVLTPRNVPLLRDSFNRADSALAIGSADSGQVWTAASGTWGISSGQVYCVSDGNGQVAAVDTGARNGNAMAEITTSGDLDNVGGNQRYHSLLVRYVDSNNFLRAFLLAGTVTLTKVVAGSGTTLGSAALTTADAINYRLRVRYVGRQIDVSVDGVVLVSYSLSDAEFAVFTSLITSVGLRQSTVSAPVVASRSDNLLVTAQ